MTKKALVSLNEPAGKDDAGYRVLEIVDAGNEFDVHSGLEWKDCPDNIEGLDKYWYNPTNGEYKKTPLGVDIVGTLTKDANGLPTERWVFDYDNEVWNKESL